jgi:translation elongation factor EF-1alpha
MPMGEAATVKSIEQEGTAIPVAFAGDSIDVGLTGVDPAVLETGGVLCHPDYPVQVATKIEARVLVLGISVPILRGAQVRSGNVVLTSSHICLALKFRTHSLPNFMLFSECFSEENM